MRRYQMAVGHRKHNDALKSCLVFGYEQRILFTLTMLTSSVIHELCPAFENSVKPVFTNHFYQLFVASECASFLVAGYF